MVYTVFYKTSSFAGYCFLDKNSIHPKRRDVFNFEHFKVTLVKFQIYLCRCGQLDETGLLNVVLYPHQRLKHSRKHYSMGSKTEVLVLGNVFLYLFRTTSHRIWNFDSIIFYLLSLVLSCS